VLLAGSLVLLFPLLALAGERILVKPVDIGVLETMIKATPGPLVAVAMASWCAPCLKEIPALNKLAAKYSPKGVRIIGISVDMDGPVPMQAAADSLKVAFPLYWVGEKGLEAMRIASIPMMILFQDGKEVQRIIGVRTEADMEKTIVGLVRLSGPDP